MDEQRVWFIYGLVDPRTEATRYVGWTFNPTKRLKGHIHTAKRTRSHKAHWIQTLLACKQKPQMVILESGFGDWQEAERRWIAHYRGQGAPLTNATTGGEGTPGYCPPVEVRAKMSRAHTGKKQSPQSTAKTRAALLGRKQSAEHVAALSAARKGKVPEAAMRAAALANRGRKQSATHVANRIAPLIGRIKPDLRRLTDDQVRLARSTAGTVSLRKCAAMLGVGQTIIHETRHRLAYRDVQD